MAHDVFVSYSAKNKTTAYAVCAMLESEGICCWIAPRDVVPGAEYGESIIDAIEQARIMVLVFTADANASPQVRREVERAAHHDIPILPVRIEDVLPARALAFFIGNINWLDALTPPLEPHLRKLADTIKKRLEPMSPRKALATEPPGAEAFQESNRQEPAIAPPAAPRPAEIRPEETPAQSPHVPQPFDIGRVARLETAERSSTRRSGEWRSRSGTVAAPRSWRVPVWLWGGGVVLALVLVSVFAALYFRTHPGPEASRAPSKPSPAIAISSSGTAKPGSDTPARQTSQEGAAPHAPAPPQPGPQPSSAASPASPSAPATTSTSSSSGGRLSGGPAAWQPSQAGAATNPQSPTSSAVRPDATAGLFKRLFGIQAAQSGAASAPNNAPKPLADLSDSASLEDTMKFIQDTLNGLGKVDFVVSGRNTRDESTFQATYADQVSNVIADSDQCRVSFHWKAWQNGSIQPEGDHDEWFSLHQLESVVVEAEEQRLTETDVAAGEPNLIAESTDPIVKAVVVRQSQRLGSADFPFTDTALANRLASALKHAAKLCGDAVNGK